MWPLLLAPAVQWAKDNSARLWKAAVILFFVALAILLVWLWIASIRKDAVQEERANQLTLKLKEFQQSALATQQVAEALENTLANQKNINAELNERLEDEINKKPIYRSCVLPADGLRLYNAAIRGPAAR